MQRRLSVLLAGIGVIAVALTWWSAARSGPIANVGTAGGFLTVTAIVFLLAGALIAFRTPARWTGPLVQVVALTVVLATARQGDVGTLSAVHGALWLATLLLPAVLIFDHPDGMRERWLRYVLGAAIAVTAGLAVPITLAAHGVRGASSTWWYTPTAHGSYSEARILFGVHTAVTSLTLVIVFGVVAGRLAGADRALRRLLDPVWIPGLLWALVVAVGQLAALSGPEWALERSRGAPSLTVPALFLFVVVPFLAVMFLLSGVVWTQLVVPRLRRTTVGMAMDSVSDPADVNRYLAAALGDQSVKIVFHHQEEAVPWVDISGRAAAISDESDRAVLILRRDGVVLAAIDFDAALAVVPDAVELGATAAAFAVDNARLVALAQARAEESRRLTARLVTAGDAVRAALHETLDAGPLRELADIDLALARGADAEDVARRLQSVTADVRGISHGIFPPELASGGLAAALPHLGSSLQRYAPAIEVTAFLAAWGDPDANLYDEVDRLRIELSEAPEQIGLLDRVSVLGGTVEGNTITIPLKGSGR